MLTKEKKEDCWRDRFIFCKHGKSTIYNFFLKTIEPIFAFLEILGEPKPLLFAK